MDQLVEAVQVVAVHEDLQRTGNPPTGDQSFFIEPPASHQRGRRHVTRFLVLSLRKGRMTV